MSHRNTKNPPSRSMEQEAQSRGFRSFEDFATVWSEKTGQPLPADEPAPDGVTRELQGRMDRAGIKGQRQRAQGAAFAELFSKPPTADQIKANLAKRARMNEEAPDWANRMHARQQLEHEQYLADPLNPNRQPPTEAEIDRYMSTDESLKPMGANPAVDHDDQLRVGAQADIDTTPPTETNVAEKAEQALEEATELPYQSDEPQVTTNDGEAAMEAARDD